MNNTLQDDVRFSRLSVAAHWFSVLLVLSAFALGWLRDFLEDSAWDEGMLIAHRQAGLTVLFMLMVRLAFRLTTKRTASPTAFRWLDILATLSHGALYGLLAALPMLGWAMTNAQGHPLNLWGLLQLPTLLAIDPDMADSLQEWHQQVGVALLLLVGLHATAALFHHHVLKDDVLAGMLPALKKRSAVNAQN